MVLNDELNIFNISDEQCDAHAMLIFDENGITKSDLRGIGVFKIGYAAILCTKRIGKLSC